MGFILQKVLYTTSPGKQIGHMRAHSAALAGLAVTSRPGLNLPHRLDRQASTCTHRTHRLPAAGAGRGITAWPRLSRSRDPATRPLPSAPRLESPGCVCGHIRPPGQYLWAHIVAVSSLWPSTASAHRLAVVLGLAHLRQTISFDSKVSRDVVRADHDLQQLPLKSCHMRREVSACGGLNHGPGSPS